MFSEIDIARLTGFLYLFVLATTFAGAALAVVKPTESPDEVAITLRNLAKHPGKQRISSIFTLVMHVAVIALAGSLYLTFSPHNRPLALLGTLWRVAEGVILAFSVINGLVLLGVAEAFVSANGAEAVALETTARAIRITELRAFTIGGMFFTFGSLIYAILFVSSRAVPLPLGWLGVVTGLFGVLGTWLALAGPNPNLSSVISVWWMAPGFLIIPYEIALGFWLLLRGAAGVSP